MADKVEPEVAEIGIRLLDDAYLAWVAAESECSQALQAWFDGGPRHGDAYYAYLAALDREEAAAIDLQRLSAVTEPCKDALLERGEQLGHNRAPTS